MHFPQLLGLMVLLLVGACFFVTLSTIVLRYEETAELYLEDYSYADVTYYGAFSDEHVEMVARQQGIVAAEGRMVQSFREDETIFRAITLTDGVNALHLFEGRLPADESECVLLQRNAKALGLSTGDTVVLGNKALQISGLAASPEYIYLVQNERTTMANPSRFAVVFVNKDFFQAGYNEIVATYSMDFSASEASEQIGAFRSTLQSNQINYELYRADLREIGSFSFVFPFIFSVLIAVVIYVMLMRMIQKDRKQIGSMKSLGMPDARIIGIYLSLFCFAALMGGLLGCLTAVFVSDVIIGVFSSMFEVPALSFALYPGLWVGTLVVALGLCIVSGLIALFSILSLLPAHALRSHIPKGARSPTLERWGFLWNRASFNTRYAIKNTLRNKGRFCAVVLGMCGSCTLLTFSLGFNDSIGNTQDKYFDDFARYDVIASFDPLLLTVEHSAAVHMDENNRALQVPAEIRDEQYTLSIVEQPFDMVNIPNEALEQGVIIPEYFAEQWNVLVGETIEINEYTAVVSAVVPQHLGLTLYTGYDYLSALDHDMPQIYNTIYARSNNMAALSAYLDAEGTEYATIEDDYSSFDAVMESMTVLIWFMVACSIILGLTVLYSVGLINLSAREFEYLFMGIMGYSHKSIMAAHIKETALQLTLAIPLGFLLGTALLESIKDEFSGNSYVIATAILPQSYALAALAVIGVTMVMALVTSRHIHKLNIVEGLKTQDD